MRGLVGGKKTMSCIQSGVGGFPARERFEDGIRHPRAAVNVATPLLALVDEAEVEVVLAVQAREPQGHAGAEDRGATLQSTQPTRVSRGVFGVNGKLRSSSCTYSSKYVNTGRRHRHLVTCAFGIWQHTRRPT